MSHAYQPQYQQQPQCRNCGQLFAAPTQNCPSCGAPQFPGATQPSGAMVPAPVYAVRAEKSVLLAVILSLLWIGLGQLYVGQVGLGITFVQTDLVLVILSFTVAGLVISIPVWCILVPLATILAGVSASNYNRTAPVLMR